MDNFMYKQLKSTYLGSEVIAEVFISYGIYVAMLLKMKKFNLKATYDNPYHY